MLQVRRRAVGRAGAVFGLGFFLRGQLGTEFADFLVQGQDLFVLQQLPVGFKLR
ncbi:hypothetical protein D3C77_808510 [compost metagenome]